MKYINLKFTIWYVLTNTCHLAWLHRLRTQFRVHSGSPGCGTQWLLMWSGHLALPSSKVNTTFTPQLFSLAQLLFASAVPLSVCFSMSASLFVYVRIRLAMTENLIGSANYQPVWDVPVGWSLPDFRGLFYLTPLANGCFGCFLLRGLWNWQAQNLMSRTHSKVHFCPHRLKTS